MKMFWLRKRDLVGRHTFQDITDSLTLIPCEEELIFFFFFLEEEDQELDGKRIRNKGQDLKEDEDLKEGVFFLI